MRLFDWFREIAGWALVAIGLWIVWEGLAYVSDRKVIEGGVVLIAAIGLVRAGILLVRLSTAARVAREWDDSIAS